MGIICGARKSFLELGWQIRNSTEAVDLQQEIQKPSTTACALSHPETKNVDLTI
jgi:hypothetical protein